VLWDRPHCTLTQLRAARAATAIIAVEVFDPAIERLTARLHLISLRARRSSTTMIQLMEKAWRVLAGS
jgi:hypothetical protein